MSVRIDVSASGKGVAGGRTVSRGVSVWVFVGMLLPDVGVAESRAVIGEVLAEMRGGEGAALLTITVIIGEGKVEKGEVQAA